VTPRLRSDFWVQALLRRCSAEGVFGSIIHKGADEAGAVAVVFTRRDGRCDLLIPAPGPAYDENGTRRFARFAVDPLTWDAVREQFAIWRKRDPDMWLVEIEAAQGFAGLNPEA
jgi:hypothetical protein